MRKIWLLVLAVAVLLGITSGSGACLNAQDVLVVYNMTCAAKNVHVVHHAATRSL